ncbi:hypothetical protein F5J12DRAFT_722217 [Pisolithus orientalis]|uniref:uncharacterized protein n=1 Tax=Pisolithus orientalis TaxID=936130 RepID=UPI002224929E|nr:uncharacterized protein F5J12DRAFT_722217 [Pisolithus orientalis]KAI6004404.1 hypothetical protein F5J12DRAFT_722217 [Pisolithus orientalis]
MLVVGPNSTCDVCLECYTNGVNIPHAINCGHVFCQKCLEHLVQNKCPLCRMRFDPKEVRRLHVDRDPNVKAIVDDDEPAQSSPSSVPVADGEAQRLLNEIARIVKEGAKVNEIRRVIDESRTYYKSQGDQYTPVRVSCLLLHNLAESQRKLSLQAEELKGLRAELDGIREHLTEELETVRRDYEQLQRTSQKEKETLLAKEKCLRDHYDEMNQSWLCFFEVLSLEQERDSLKQTLARFQSSYSESQRSAYFYASEGKRSPSGSEDPSMLKKRSMMKEKFIDGDEMDFHLSPLAEIAAPLASTFPGFSALADESDDEDIKKMKKKKLLGTLEEDESCPESTLADLIRQPLTSEPIPIPSRECLSHQPSNSVAMSVTADWVSGFPSSRADDVVMGGSRPSSPCRRSSSDRHVPSSSQAPRTSMKTSHTWQIVSSGVSKLHDLLDSPRPPPSLSQSAATTSSRPDIPRSSTARPPILAQPSASRPLVPVRPSSASVHPGSSSSVVFVEDSYFAPSERRPLVSASEAAMQLERERQQEKERRRQLESSSAAQNSLRDTTNAPIASSHYHQPHRYKYGNDRMKPMQPLPSAACV